VIKNGVPVDTPEVQHAKAAHLAAIAKAKADPHYSADYHHEPEHHGEPAHHHVEHHQPKYHGPEHHPIIKNGVPVDTPAVQHATAKHLAALAKEQAQHGYGHHDEHSHHY
jgi:hypothetical protein